MHLCRLGPERSSYYPPREGRPRKCAAQRKCASTPSQRTGPGSKKCCAPIIFYIKKIHKPEKFHDSIHTYINKEKTISTN